MARHSSAAFFFLSGMEDGAGIRIPAQRNDKTQPRDPL